jgi:hypothetical protein
MAGGEASFPPSVAPVASVWCRQVDNEAESPGYTAIPDEFPGRRETLEAIRIVGNLTINIADTHDYWDPDPASSLSFYPNLFLYPAGSGQYTAVGRMFLSTEDRPRLGMKTLVFSTADLLASGDFGGLVLRAYGTMDGRAGRTLPPPDPSLYQALGEGFLFHRGSTEPVVVIASEQWEPASRTVLDLIRVMPSSLVALGAFLVFPYFLPATKVNLHEFTEQIPLALALMRVPRAEAGGERHEKRMESWKAQPVALRDLTGGAPPAKGRETLPLVLQYVRDHAESRGIEVAQRVDRVEAPRLPPVLADLEHQGGRDRRKEMWRIGTAMETAALLLAHPRGRTASVSSETSKRANEYLGATPGEAAILSPATPAPPAAAPGPSSPAPPARSPSGPAVPAWLQAPPSITLPRSEGPGVPVSTADDPSLRPPPAPTSAAASGPLGPSAPAAPDPAPSSPSPAASAAPSAPPAVAPAPRPSLFSRVPPFPPASSVPPVPPAPRPAAPTFPPAAPAPAPAPSPPAVDGAAIDAKVAAALRDAEERWRRELSVRLQETADAASRAGASAQTDLAARVAALEGRPAPTPGISAADVDARLQAAIAPAAAELDARVAEQVHRSTEGWAERFRRELQDSTDLMVARSSRAEEELRSALAAQLELEILEARQQGTVVREETEATVRKVLDERLAEAEREQTQRIRDAEERMVHLIEGRAKEAEGRLSHTLSGQMERIAASADERYGQAERRSAAERDARLAEVTDAQTAAIAGLQVRMQSFVEQKLRELQVQEQEKTLSLLARLKASLEESVERSLASPTFDAALRGRIVEGLEEVRAQQASSFGKLVAESEETFRRERDEAAARLQDLEGRLGQRESDLANLEATVRHELSDVDRRLLVVNDHVLPLVRQTWLKVSQHERDDRSRPHDAKIADVRRELAQEIARVERELRGQTTDLRDRLEASVASHGRIWLNLLRQMSPEGGLPPAASPGGHRLPRRMARSGGMGPAASGSDPGAGDAAPFSDLPANPMAPDDNPGDRPPPDPRRKPRRA